MRIFCYMAASMAGLLFGMWVAPLDPSSVTEHGSER